MDILESLLNLVRKNLLDIITILWGIWVTGVALGAIACTVSTILHRRTISRFQQGYEQAQRRSDDDAGRFDLDPEHLQNLLKRREAELREDAERMGLDFGLQGVLENFRGRIQQKLANLSATHQEILNRLQNIYAGLEDFKGLCGPDQISLALMGLKRGQMGRAVALLKRAQFLLYQQLAGPTGSSMAVARDTGLAAKAAFLLGQLAETDFNYFTATQYYQQAADLQPANLVYLNAAAELSYAFGEFQETGHLLEEVLKIQEKLLGPEHLDLAQTLNNLAVLRHTQGRVAEADAFYLWALEICEANLHPGDQDMVNLIQNYAAFLQEVGRRREAEAFKIRVALA
jgi:tetratricopeptide (TPR) repeat protein